MNQTIITILWLLGAVTICAQTNVFEINANNIVGKNTHFWKTSGIDLLYYLAEKPSGQSIDGPMVSSFFYENQIANVY